MSSVTTAPRLAHPDTSTVFVGGLLSLFGAGLSVPLTIFFGKRLLKKYDAEPERWARRELVVTGIRMAWIGLALTPLWILIWSIG